VFLRKQSKVDHDRSIFSASITIAREAASTGRWGVVVPIFRYEDTRRKTLRKLASVGRDEWPLPAHHRHWTPGKGSLLST
jgi:hypothetical protein